MDDLISRISVQTCRQAGLSVVYTELLNFGGDEIYFKNEHGAHRQDVRRVALRVRQERGDGPADRGRQARSSTRRWTRRSAPSDEIIVIAEDDSTVHLSGEHGVDAIKNDASRARARAARARAHADPRLEPPWAADHHRARQLRRRGLGDDASSRMSTQPDLAEDEAPDRRRSSAATRRIAICSTASTSRRSTTSSSSATPTSSRRSAPTRRRS